MPRNTCLTPLSSVMIEITTSAARRDRARMSARRTRLPCRPAFIAPASRSQAVTSQPLAVSRAVDGAAHAAQSDQPDFHFRLFLFVVMRPAGSMRLTSPGELLRGREMPVALHRRHIRKR